MDGALRDFQKLDEGILDFVKRGFKSAKDAVVKVGQKIRDILTRFLKTVFKRFTDTVKNLFQTKPNERTGKTLSQERPRGFNQGKR